MTPAEAVGLARKHGELLAQIARIEQDGMPSKASFLAQIDRETQGLTSKEIKAFSVLIGQPGNSIHRLVDRCWAFLSNGSVPGFAHASPPHSPTIGDSQLAQLCKLDSDLMPVIEAAARNLSPHDIWLRAVRLWTPQPGRFAFDDDGQRLAAVEALQAECVAVLERLAELGALGAEEGVVGWTLPGARPEPPGPLTASSLDQRDWHKAALWLWTQWAQVPPVEILPRDSLGLRLAEWVGQHGERRLPRKPSDSHYAVYGSRMGL